MVQTIITPKGYKEEDNLERLQRMRITYYKELIKKLEILRIQKTTMIHSYNIIVKDIDKDIEKEKQRQKTIKG